MVWLYRWPIPPIPVGRKVFSSFKWFLPAFATSEERRGGGAAKHIGTVLLLYVKIFLLNIWRKRYRVSVILWRILHSMFQTWSLEGYRLFFLLIFWMSVLISIVRLTLCPFFLVVNLKITVLLVAAVSAVAYPFVTVLRLVGASKFYSQILGM